MSHLSRILGCDLARVACSLALCALCGCKATSAAPDDEEPPAGPIAVRCERASSETIAEHVQLRGVVRPPPEHEVVVSALVAGRVHELRVHEGDRVTRGQVLASIDDPELGAATSEAEAARAAAQAGFDHARNALARAQRLLDEGIAARREVEDASAALDAAKAELEAAQARKGLASAKHARAQVTAPISGVVVRLHRALGDVVDGTSQTPLLEIADPAVLELRCDVPAAALVRLSAGAPAEIELDVLAGQMLRGHVAMVPAALDAQTALGSVRVAIDADSAPAEVALKIGLAGHANVNIGAHANATLVPTTALRRSTSGADELVVCARSENGTTVAQVREVKTGARQAERIEIVSGLQPSESVVVDHALGLEDGVALAPTPSGHAK